MPITTDFVLNNIFKNLPSIPFALICAQSTHDKDEGHIIKLNCNWSYEIRLFTGEAVLISDLGEYEEVDEAKAKVLMVLDQNKLRIKEAIVVFDSEYQILVNYHFDPTGHLMYTFNSVRFSRDEVAIEYDLFATELDCKECLKDFQLFVDTIRRDTAAEHVVLEGPALLQTIRKRKLERILKEYL